MADPGRRGPRHPPRRLELTARCTTSWPAAPTKSRSRRRGRRRPRAPKHPRQCLLHARGATMLAHATVDKLTGLRLLAWPRPSSVSSAPPSSPSLSLRRSRRRARARPRRAGPAGYECTHGLLSLRQHQLRRDRPALRFARRSRTGPLQGIRGSRASRSKQERGEARTGSQPSPLSPVRKTRLLRLGSRAGSEDPDTRKLAGRLTGRDVHGPNCYEQRGPPGQPRRIDQACNSVYVLKRC